MRKNKLFLGSVIMTGFVLSVNASDIVGDINNTQNNEQLVASIFRSPPNCILFNSSC